MIYLRKGGNAKGRDGRLKQQMHILDHELSEIVYGVHEAERGHSIPGQIPHEIGTHHPGNVLLSRKDRKGNARECRCVTEPSSQKSSC